MNDVGDVVTIEPEARSSMRSRGKHIMLDRVTTVLGDISPEELGLTLIHEHVICDLSCLFKLPSGAAQRRLAREQVNMANLHVLLHGNLHAIRDNLLLDDVDLAAEEIQAFKRAGGSTIVDATIIGLGRDPLALRHVAVVTGINLIAGCGYYVDLCHPSTLGTKSADEISDEIVSEIRDGVAGTGVKPGIIGEIGISQRMTENEEKVLRASARAHIETGLTISVHVAIRGRQRCALSVLDILEEEGVVLNRVIINHIDHYVTRDYDYLRTVAERGAYLGFDTFGHEKHRIYQLPQDSEVMGETWAIYQPPQDPDRVKTISRLVGEGYINKILVSGDVCKKTDLHRYGGYGYDHVLTNVVPMLRIEGLQQNEIDQILVGNPRSALTGQV